MNIAQLKRLVGNPDAYALQSPDGSWRPVREPLTQSVLEGHLRRVYTVGTYIGHSTPEGTVSRTLVLDFDSGDQAHKDAKKASQAVRLLGIPGGMVGVEFSGRKGYHVWVALAKYRPNAELRRVGRAVLALADLPSNTEVFPKQDEVRDLGNLVKLPGGIHQVTQASNDFITPPPVPVPITLWQKVFDRLPAEQVASRSTSPVDNRFPCLSEIQEGVTEMRNIKLFHLACMLRRHGVEEDLLRVSLEHVNSLGEPVDHSELEGIIRNSAHSGPVCGQLPQDTQDACGELCIKARTSGLYTRPGQVRHAGEGESVVVRVESRVDNVVVFAHDDIETAKGRMREGK